MRKGKNKSGRGLCLPFQHGPWSKLLPDHPVLGHGKSLLEWAGDQLTLGQLGYSGVQCMRDILGCLSFRNTGIPVYLQSEAGL